MSVKGTIETGHEDMVHDAQLDYYGKRLATASSDTTVKVFDVVGEESGGQPAVLNGYASTRLWPFGEGVWR